MWNEFHKTQIFLYWKSQSHNSAYIFYVFFYKVQVFWKGHKNLKKIFHWFWRYWLNIKTSGRFFSNFVAFSQYPNFKRGKSKEFLDNYLLLTFFSSKSFPEFFIEFVLDRDQNKRHFCRLRWLNELRGKRRNTTIL